MLNINEMQSLAEKCEGWCTSEKMKELALLVYENQLMVSVEIGVFNGRSLIPQAYAYKQLNRGMVYGIDPWDQQAAMQIGHDKINQDTLKIDFNGMYEDLKRKLQEFQLSSYVALIRVKAEDVEDRFSKESIDFLHIDGNHGEEAVLNDIKLYFPKVKKGGFICFDDTTWTTTPKAIEYAKERCTSVYKEFFNNIILVK